MRYSLQKTLAMLGIVLGIFSLSSLPLAGTQGVDLKIETTDGVDTTQGISAYTLNEIQTTSVTGAAGSEVRIYARPAPTYFVEWACSPTYKDVDGKTINGIITSEDGEKITVKLQEGQTYKITLRFVPTKDTRCRINVGTLPLPVESGWDVSLSVKSVPVVPAEANGIKYFEVPITSIVDVSIVPKDAVKSADHSLTKWTISNPNAIIGGDTSPTVRLFVMGDLDVKANFIRKSKRLTVLPGAGAGAPGSTSISSQYAVEGGEVELEAKPYGTSYAFDRWYVRKGNVSFVQGSAVNKEVKIKLDSPSGDGWTVEALFKNNWNPETSLHVTTEHGKVTVKKQYQTSITTVQSGESKTITCAQGDTFNITAVADEGYRFIKWEVGNASVGDENSSGTSLKIVTGKKAATLRPVWELKTSRLTLKVDPADNPERGTLRAESGVELVSTTTTVGEAEKIFATDSDVTLVASPEPGYYFVNWTSTFVALEPKNSSTSPVQGTIKLSRPATVTAFFQKLPEVYTLNLTAEAGGAVDVSYLSNHPMNGAIRTEITVPAGSTAVLAGIVSGTEVKIEAKSSGGYVFEKWETSLGTAITPDSLPSAKFAMDGNRRVTAKFGKTAFSLKVEVDPGDAFEAGCFVRINNAKQTSNPSETTHLKTESAPTLVAEAVEAGVWSFKGWQVDNLPLTSGQAQTSVTMDEDHVVKAVFERSHTLTTKVSPEGSGTVTGGGTHMSGTSASVKATASAGKVFSHWTGDINGIAPSATANPITVPINMDRNLVANMVAAHEVSVSVGPATGSVSAFPALTVADAKLIAVSASQSTFTTSGGELVSTLHPAASELSPSGYLAEGKSVSLSAPATLDGGKWLFTRWISGTNDATGTEIGISRTVSFTPVANATLMPVYTDQRLLSVKVTLDGSDVTDLSVNVGGTSMTTNAAPKSVVAGAAVALIAPEQSGRVFDRWENVDGGSVSASNATVTLGGDVASRTIVARYRNVHPLSVGLRTIPSADAGLLPLSECVSAHRDVARTVPFPLTTNPTVLSITSGDTVWLKASATVTFGAKEYRFAGWDTNGDNVPEIASSETTQTVSSGASIHAVYILQCTLSFKAFYDSSYWGSLDITQSAVSTFAPVPNPALRKYDYDTEVSLYVGQTLPGSSYWSYNFLNWTSSPAGAIILNGSASKVKMDGDKTVIAHYTMGQPVLRINFNVNSMLNPENLPQGLSVSARVNNGPPKIFRPPTSLTQDYFYQNEVELTASVSEGYVFMGWTNPVVQDSGNQLKGKIVMDNNKEAIASFRTIHSIELTTTTLPNGSGIGGVPSATNYRSEVSSNKYTAYFGDAVTYAANPSAGFRFLRWEIYDENDVLSETRNGSPLTYTVDKNQRIRAVYAKEYEVVFKTVPADGSGGTVSPSGSKVCYYGQKVDLSVAPNYAHDWGFDSWLAPGVSLYDSAQPGNIGATLNGQTTAPTSILVTGAHEIAAKFTKAGSEKNLTVNIRLDGVDNSSACPLLVKASGSSVPPSTISPETVTTMKGGDTKQYYRNDPVQLDATVPDALASTYAFFAWESEGDTSPVRTFAMPAGDKTVTAIYRTRAKLTMAVVPEGAGKTTPTVGVRDVFVGQTIPIVAAPSDEHIDDKVFSHWTETPSTGRISDVSMADTAITVDGTVKKATAHFDNGYRLEVKVRYENTPNATDDIRTYHEVTGSRDTVATGGGGNRAGVQSSLTAKLMASVLTIKVGTTVTIRADAIQSYNFVGWDTNGDATVDIPGSQSLAVLMDSPKTYTAIFEKKRVKFHVHTHPSNLPPELSGIVRGVADGPYKVLSTGNPMVYEVFYRAIPQLKAEGSGTGKFNFTGWFYGIGYNGDPRLMFSKEPETVYPDPENLENADTHVTAVFFPSGYHRLVIFTNPDEHIDIHNVNSPSAAFSEYVTWAGGRAAYVGYVAIGLGGTRVSIHANSAPVPTPAAPNNNLGFLRWNPMPGYERVADWFDPRYKNDAVLAFPQSEGELHIEAYYTPPGGYAITLKFDFVEEGITFNEGGGIYFGDGIFGSVVGSTPNEGGGALLNANRNRLIDWATFSQGHTETFSENATMTAGPLSVVSWTYQKGAADPVARAGGGAFTTDPGVAGQSEIVTAHVEVSWKTVSLAPTIFKKPADWVSPSVGNAKFTFMKRLLSQGNYGNPFDVINPLAVTPAPAPHLMKYKRVRGGSAPVLTAAFAPSGYRFAGWDTNGDGVEDLQWNVSDVDIDSPTWSSHVVWNAWPSSWPKEMTADIVVAPVYIQRSALTLKIETPNNATSKDKVSSTPAVLGVGHAVEGNDEVFVVTDTEIVDFNSKFTFTAIPQAYHVVSEWVVEKYKTEGSSAATTEVIACDGSAGNKTLSVTMDYPTKVTARFAMQKFNLVLNVADSRTVGKHGKVRIVGSPGPDYEVSGLFDYASIQNIEAIPDAGYVFMGWTVVANGGPPYDNAAEPRNAESPSSLATTVFIDRSKTLTAHFERAVTLETKTDPTNIGAGSPSILSPEVGVYSSLEGSPLVDGRGVTISVAKNPEIDGAYDFIKWKITDEDHPEASPREESASSVNLTLKGDTVATAVYSKLHQIQLSNALVDGAPIPNVTSLTSSASPVVRHSASILTVNELAAGSANIREMDTINLVASPGPHYEFVRWEISVGGVAQPPNTQSSVTLAASGDIVAKAVFRPKNYTLTVIIDPISSPIPVASVVGGSTAAGSHNFLTEGAWSLPYGSRVELTAGPAVHYRFVAWKDGNVVFDPLPESPNSCSLELAENKTIHAVFERSEYRLSYTIEPEGKGSVTLGDNTPLAPTTFHPADANVTVKAVDTASTVFDKWTGSIVGTSSAKEQTLKMNQDRDIAAHFKDAVTLTLSRIPDDDVYGTVSLGTDTPPRRSSGNAHTFAVGDRVHLIATPSNTHHSFDGWTFSPSEGKPDGVDVSSNNIEFHIAKTVAVTGAFSKKTYTLKVTATKAGVSVAPSVVATKLVADEGQPAEHDFLKAPEMSRLYSPVTVPLKAEAKITSSGTERYRFNKWTNHDTGALVSASATRNFVFDQNVWLDADFIRQLKVTINNGLDVTHAEVVELGGTVSPAAGDHYYDVGGTFAVTATAPEGYEFDSWQGDVSGAKTNTVADDKSSATLEFEVTDAFAGGGDLSLTPLFKRKHYKIDAAVWDKSSNVEGGGTLSINAAMKINDEYYHFDQVTVVLDSIWAGYRFVGWDLDGDFIPDAEGAINGSGKRIYVFTVTGTKTIQAVVTRVHTLDLSASPPDKSLGSVHVVGSQGNELPVPIVGGFRYEFDHGTQVSIKGEPNPDVSSAFEMWLGDVVLGETYSSTTTIEMNNSKSIVGRFKIVETRNLTLSVAEGDGEIWLNINGNLTKVLPGTSRTFAFPLGHIIVLQANPNAGYSFGSWTPQEAVQGSSAIVSVKVDENKSIQAHFVIRQNVLTTKASPQNAGTAVALTPGPYPYVNGNPVVVGIKATANPGWEFVRWDFDDSTESNHHVTVDHDRTVTAIFKKKAGNASLAVFFNPAGSGTATIVEKPGEEYPTYTITVTPSAGYSFGGWAGESAGDLYDTDPFAVLSRVISLDRDGEFRIVANMERKREPLFTSTEPDDVAGLSIRAYVEGAEPGPPARDYPHGTTVVLEALSANLGYAFSSWEGDASGSGVTCSLKMDEAKDVIARFKVQPRRFLLTLRLHEDSVSGPYESLKMEGVPGAITAPGVHLLQRDVLETDGEILIYYNVESPSMYAFEGWFDVGPESLRIYSSNDNSGSAHLLVTENHVVKGKFRSLRRLLQTQAFTDGRQNEPDALPFVSPGGTVAWTQIIANESEEITIKAHPHPDYVVSKWEVASASAQIISRNDTPDEEGSVSVTLLTFAGFDNVLLTVHFALGGDTGSSSVLNIHHKVEKPGATKTTIEGADKPSPGHIILDK
jgi:hypothetical protein